MPLLGGKRIPHSLSLVLRPYYRSSPYPIVCHSLYVCYASSSMLSTLFCSSAPRSPLSAAVQRGARHFRTERGVERKSGRVEECHSERAVERRSDRAIERQSGRAIEQQSSKRRRMSLIPGDMFCRQQNALLCEIPI